MAQSPRLIKNLQCLRNRLALSRRSSAVLTAPSKMPDITLPVVLFGIHEGAKDDIDEFRELEQTLVQIEKRHMASGTTIEPRGGERLFLGFLFGLRREALPLFEDFLSDGVFIQCSFAVSNRARTSGLSPFRPPRFLCCTRSAGRTDLHALATAVHDWLSPQGSFISVITDTRMPRPITSHVCAPSISSQTRTQRVHRMQRL